MNGRNNTGNEKKQRMKLKTKNEFRELLPPLSIEEYTNLEIDCIKNGIREPLLIWKNIIIDGHNRYSIAQKNKLLFKTKTMDFKNKSEVINWIIFNQLSRRNLTNEARAYFIGLLYKHTKQKRENNLLNNTERQNLPIDTSKKIAGEYGISPKSVRNNETFTDIIDRIGIFNSKLKNDILAGNTNLNKTDLLRIAALDDRRLKEILPKLEKGRNIPLLVKSIERRIRKEKIIGEAGKRRNTDNSLVDIFTTKRKYRVVYIDPPFEYEFDSPLFKASKDHYPTMKIAEIKNLPIERIAEKNSVLFFWSPSPLIEKSLEIINHWKFEYKSMFVWDKVKHNMGHYNSVRHEILLIAVKGKCLPDTDKLFDSVVMIERLKNHSEKPKEFRELIERMYVAGNRIELFSRGKTDKWDRWGYEA
jgi:N6-adenosine-specific RNA methylase IME4